MMGQSDQYEEMITPRNDQQQNMERVDEDNEEDMAGHDESAMKQQ
jgi:hypothetical protein